MLNRMIAIKILLHLRTVIVYIVFHIGKWII